MQKSVMTCALIALTLGLVACKGGSSSSQGSAVEPMTNQELGELFVANFNEMYAYWDGDYGPGKIVDPDAEYVIPESLSLVKADTEQGGNWIVVFDSFFNMHIALNLEDYNGETWGELWAWLGLDENGQFIGLGTKHGMPVFPLGDGTFEGLSFNEELGFPEPNGMIFEKGSKTAYDEELTAAVTDVSALKGYANVLVSEYGLPEDKAMEFSKITQRLATADKRSLSDQDYSNFTAEVLGSKGALGRYQNAISKAMETGDHSDLNKEIERTGRHHGLESGQVRNIVEKIVFGKN